VRVHRPYYTRYKSSRTHLPRLCAHNDLRNRYVCENTRMELFHALNRGVEKRVIFMDEQDRFRIVHGLLLYNSPRSANNTTFLIENDNDFLSRYQESERIVDLHAWC